MEEPTIQPVPAGEPVSLSDVPLAPPRPSQDVFGQRLQRRRRRLFWRRTTLVTLGLCILAGIWLRFTESGRDITGTVGLGVQMYRSQNPNLIFDQFGSDQVNILLIGRDQNQKVIFHRGKAVWHVADNSPARSDTMIVVCLDRAHNKIRMVSLPRDAMVHMPPNKYDVDLAKLNAAHAYGGPAMLIQTLHDQLGLTIHRHAVIQFSGFKKLIDKVGGVEVDVMGALKRNGSRGDLNYDDNWGGLHIHLKPGQQWLNGEQAHNYVRFRMDLEGDPGRIRRQQQVMRALAKRIMQQPVYKLPGLIQEVRKNFLSDLTEPELASAATFARGIGASGKIQPITLFGYFGDRGKFILNRPKNERLLSYIFGPTFNADHFLPQEPWTTRDEMGLENDTSPEARAILTGAGLLGHQRLASSTPAASSTEASSQEPTDTTPTSEPRTHRTHRPRRTATPLRPATHATLSVEDRFREGLGATHESPQPPKSPESPVPQPD